MGGALTGIAAVLGLSVLQAASPQLTFMMFGIVVAIAAIVGAVLAWRLSAPVADMWIRLVATVGVIVATVLLGFATVPAQIFGLPGLLGLMLIELVVSLLASRWARSEASASGSRASA